MCSSDLALGRMPARGVIVTTKAETGGFDFVSRFFAPAVGDYYRQGIMAWSGTPEARALYAIEDPFSYRDRLTLPKLLINACGDQFFLPDSSQFYFGALPGPKYLRYIPNTDHSMKGSDAPRTIAAWHHAILTGAALPKLSWHQDAGDALIVSTATPPRRATVSAIRLPATAVMFATAIGIVVPTRSGVVRSTSNREPTSDMLGTINTSLYVRSCTGKIGRAHV